jgi:translation initiation factor IF-1
VAPPVPAAIIPVNLQEENERRQHGPLVPSHINGFFYILSAEQPIELEGTIQTVLPGTMFRVVLDNQHQVLAHISGKMRKHFVRLTAGDRVRMEMSPYDVSKARITYRLR